MFASGTSTPVQARRQHLQGSPSQFGSTLDMQSSADRRHFGSTDDVAIFIDDTLDSATVRCVSNSPSAMAILSPQRMPIQRRGGHMDATQLDSLFSNGFSGGGCDGYVAGMSSSAKKTKQASHSLISKSGAALRMFASDVTNASTMPPGSTVNSTTRHSNDLFVTPSGKQRTCVTTGTSPAPAMMLECHDAACSAMSPQSAHHSLSMNPLGFVPLAEFERVERERHRYQRMYEHQKQLYEDMAASQQETYGKLQDKIVEVVALSTRNEESKRFIRQLKKEMLDCRTRTLDLHNRNWDESRIDRHHQSKLQALLEAQEAQFTSMLQQQEGKMAGLEGLIRDLTALRGESASLQVSQLDHLLKASYAKNAALFGDMIRQSRQMEFLVERKSELERSVEVLRRDMKDLERATANERRAIHAQHERYAEQVSEQQHMILDLRQCLVRSMASDTSSSDSDDASSPPRVVDEEHIGEVGHHTRGMMDASPTDESPTTPVLFAPRRSAGAGRQDGRPATSLLSSVLVNCSEGSEWGPLPSSPQSGLEGVQERPPEGLPPTTQSSSYRPVRRIRAVPPPPACEGPRDA